MRSASFRVFGGIVFVLWLAGIAVSVDVSAQTAQTRSNAPGSSSIYVVQRGDSLAGIARSHRVTIEALRSANGLTNNLIRIGQRLKILAGAAAAPAGRHSLWRVQGPRATVYLLGSVHVLKKEDYPLASELEAAFTNSAVLAFEADIGELDGPANQMKLLSKSMLPPGQTLAQELSPAVFSGFTNELAIAGLPISMFERLKPAIAAVTLTVLELQKLGFDPEYGLDKHFYARARKEGKPVAALETVDFQFDLLNSFSSEESELLMKTTLEDIDRTKKECTEMIAAWRTGDADKLDTLLNEASREAPALFKRLLLDRNHNWLPKIRNWAQGDQNVLVVVGAAHLVGNQGVVSLLRKEGFKVEQL